MKSPSLAMIQEVLMRAVCIAFFGNALHRFVLDFVATSRPTSAIFVVFLTLVTVFSTFRSIPKTVTQNPVEWLVAVLGTVMVAFMQPAGTERIFAGELLQVAGTLIVMTGLLSLNRSFGVVPANRGIKTGGLYRVVRHPLYMGYVFSDAGMLVSQFTVWNLWICVMALVFMVLRIRFEEALLMGDAEYAAYAARTRYHLIPGVW